MIVGSFVLFFFFFQAEDGIRDATVTGVQTCALPISARIWGTPTTMMWVYRLGLEHAKRYMLTGDPIDGPTAVRLGLATQSLPAEDLGTTGEGFARRLAP